MCKKYCWNCSTWICEIIRYLKSIVDDSVIMCNEIISVTNISSTNVTNTLPVNVMSTVSINSDHKKKDIN